MAGALADAIAVVVGHQVELVCAGRTDAGVHAQGQVVHVDVREDVDRARLVRSVNTLLKPSVVVRSAEVAPAGFDARRSARARHYRYLILEDRPRTRCSPRWRGTCRARSTCGPWRARRRLAGRARLQGLLPARPGDRGGGAHPSTGARRPLRGIPVRPGELGPDARLLRFDISATSFCHQMVRSVVGTLVEVGRGRRRASDVNWLLQSGDRSRVGGVIAPPQGLCLVGVDYDE